MEPQQNNPQKHIESPQQSTPASPTQPQQPLTSNTPASSTQGPDEWFKSDAPETIAKKPFYKTLIDKIYRDRRILAVVIIIGALFISGTSFGLYKLQQQTKLTDAGVSVPLDTSQQTSSSNNDIAETNQEPSPAPATSTPTAGATTAPANTTPSGAASTPTPPAPTPTSNPRKTYDISYTNDCYSPSTITIKAGDTIKFKNNSTKNMYPATDNHPTHTIYAGFDAGKDIAPGPTYSFTFTRIGSWGYHDHNKPNCDGTITVS